MNCRSLIYSNTFSHLENNHISYILPAFNSAKANIAQIIAFTKMYFPKAIVYKNHLSKRLNNLPPGFPSNNNYSELQNKLLPVKMPKPMNGAVDAIKTSINATKSKQSAKRVLRFLSEVPYTVRRLLSRFVSFCQLNSTGEFLSPENDLHDAMVAGAYHHF